MQERTITIGSAGKTWSVTGWKTGWAIGPESLGLSLTFKKKRPQVGNFLERPLKLVIPMQTFYVNTLGSGTTPIQGLFSSNLDYYIKARKELNF